MRPHRSIFSLSACVLVCLRGAGGATNGAVRCGRLPRRRRKCDVGARHIAFGITLELLNEVDTLENDARTLLAEVPSDEGAVLHSHGSALADGEADIRDLADFDRRPIALGDLERLAASLHIRDG